MYQWLIEVQTSDGAIGSALNSETPIPADRNPTTEAELFQVSWASVISAGLAAVSRCSTSA